VSCLYRVALKMLASSLKAGGDVDMARRKENKEDAVRAAGEGSFGILVSEEINRKERKSAIVWLQARRGLHGGAIDIVWWKGRSVRRRPRVTNRVPASRRVATSHAVFFHPSPLRIRDQLEEQRANMRPWLLLVCAS
jgi:hypothetical protein